MYDNSWTGIASSNAFKEEFTYDANGNILTLKRRDQAGVLLDDLVYKYERLSNSYSRNSNRLKAAQDAVTGQTAIKDIASGQVSDGANPSLDNYQYDEIGNLKEDKKENITLIEWTVYGKVKSITYTDGTTITFFYDATGNRVHKKLVSGATTEHTWYVRDASGNVLTVYEGAGSSELFAEEQVVYGSSRIGERKPHINVANMTGPATAENQLAAADLLTVSASPWLLAVVQYPNQSLLADAAQIQIGQQPFPYRPKFYEHKLGLKEYELSNHLGNVLAVIGDAKTDMGLTSMPVDDQFEVSGSTDSWTPETGISLSNDNGRLKAVCSTCGGSSSGTDRLFSAVTGQEYRVTVTVDLGTTTALVYAHITKASSSTPIKTVTITSSGTYSFTFTANDPSMRLKLGNDPSDGVFAFWADDVYISSASRYSAKVLSAQDYYAFGMIMPERRFNADKYRFGFQGQEKDDEVKGLGNSVSFEYRVHDSRLGRFLSIDPLVTKYPYYSPYQFSGNRVIDMIELEGLEPTESGSYAGQGAIAPQRDESGNACEGTDNYRWVWDNISDWKAANVAITSSELTSLFPSANAENVKTLETTINLSGNGFGFSNMNILAHYLAQAGHETGGFSEVSIEESLYYKTLDRVSAVFGSSSTAYTNTAANTDKYLKNSENFANMAYANKIGNGDEASGDGYLFRGRGFFQLTGRENYANFTTAYNNTFGTSEDFKLNPTKVATDKNIAIISSLWYFQKNTIPKINNGSSFKTVTKTINAGAVGLEERQTIYNQAINLFNQ